MAIDTNKLQQQAAELFMQRLQALLPALFNAVVGTQGVAQPLFISLQQRLHACLFHGIASLVFAAAKIVSLFSS